MSPTVPELISAFQTSHIAAGHSLKTVSWYGESLNAFFRWLEVENLHHGDWLRRDVVEAYLAQAKKGGNRPATVANKFRSLHGFFGWLQARGYIEASPLTGMKPPRVSKKPPRRGAVGEFEQLVAAIGGKSWVDLRDRLVLNVLFLCGLRRTECAMLTREDFMTGEHLLWVRHGKGDRDRFVPLLPSVERAFIAYIFERPAHTSERLFLGSDGGGHPTIPLSSDAIYQMLRRRCKAAGMRRINPHAWRHGLAMHLLNTGGDMSLVQKMLGHAQITTTAEVYAEWLTAGLQREFVTKMGGVGN